jgi:hypothetical protein
VFSMGRPVRSKPVIDVLPGMKAGDSYGATHEQARV